jgi:two-component system OmpR family sensor kinase
MKKHRFADIFVSNSLRFQLLSRSLLILSILLLLIGVFQYIFMQQFLYRNTAESIHTQLASIPPNAWMGKGDFSDRENSKGPPRFLMSDLSIAFIDKNGNYSVLSTQGSASPQLSTQEYQQIMNTRSRLEYRPFKDENGNERLLVFQMSGGPEHSQGMLQASTSTKPIKDVLIRQLLTFLSLSILALLVGLLAFLPVLKRTLIPLSNMVDTVKQIDSGNLAERLPANQNQMEIDRLSASFNGMLERLEFSFEAEKEAKEQMRRFVADASHELRTPLTSIHGFLEVLLRGAANQPDQLFKALRSMYGESERINKLVHDLLLLARLDRTPTFQMSEGMLDEVIRDMEPQLRLLAGERTVNLFLKPDTRCMFDSDKMKQVILNLFNNAVQHTQPNTGNINLSLEETAAGIQLDVQDNGPGIAAEHLSHVFNRFYRIDSSRARKNGGAGLGLSITKSIVDLHGGSISVESKEAEGSTFRVLLPLYKKS